MADNVTAPAAATVFATDDIGGTHYPRTKMAWGPDGTANDADVATGKPMPIQLRSATGLVPFGEPTDAANTATNTTSVSAISIWKQISSSVQSLVTTSLPVGSGTAAAAGRVTLATDDTRAYSAVTTLTRTSDTNAYAANDVLGSATGSTAALTFAAMGPTGQRVMLTSAALEIDAAAIISGETSYRLHLYNVTPPSALGDNVAHDLPSGDRGSYLGYVDLGIPVDLGSTLYVEANSINKVVKLSGTALYGYLVTIGAYTPTSARAHVITLHTVAL